MLRLSRDGLKQTAAWERSGFQMPAFDVAAMAAKTKAEPIWLHVGGGNLFRGLIAPLQQTLLDAGIVDRGIIVVSPYDAEIVERIYRPCDNLGVLVWLHPNGRQERRVIASVAESLVGDPGAAQDWQRLQEIVTAPSLRWVSLTITEKGYRLTDLAGAWLPDVEQDLKQGPRQPRHTMSKLTALAYARYRAGRLPIAWISMDNFSGNGDRLRASVTAIARQWAERGWVEPGFLDYLDDPAEVSFPWTMVDKITPSPSPDVQAALTAAGVAGMDILRTRKNTAIAPFVNAEVPQYLVVEDHFPNGRPPLERAAGVWFTDRETVAKVERMKVTTCLNPLHTALAVFGCLLGYTSIAAAVQDEALRQLLACIGYREGIPVVTDPGIIQPQAFLQEVLEQRLPNPYIPDTPQRIATDTSQKMAIRFGETLKAYHARPDLDVRTLRGIPLVIAGWLRYLLGVDDEGEPMALSPDPMLDTLTTHLQGVELGHPDRYSGQLRAILQNHQLFGVNLYEIRLGERIEQDFLALIAGRHAVRATLTRRFGSSR
ncbi:mannitol dehydrogenase family protein [Alicyclobacillus shizuokensis]|uniref:mannitol dehydrogenase family protein n=1 Tax=Alicyclobacillus shizuokensis TaxID=392014 RepID=UPI000830DE92|nr:mannitol dehydrogenase family protein [Alicyclobacillus shizuokensis]MCL6625320.1 mannitol dehydrogenase family protein [Alicyclobacillus shizuokensis]